MTTPRRRADRNLFVDSSAFFALFNSAEPQHQAARAVLERAASEATGLLTTNFVVAETHALTLARIGHVPATRFLRTMEQTSIRVIRATIRDEAVGREIIDRYEDKDCSLTDAISFAVMRRLGITTAFSFDRDFVRFGFIPAT